MSVSLGPQALRAGISLGGLCSIRKGLSEYTPPEYDEDTCRPGKKMRFSKFLYSTAGVPHTAHDVTRKRVRTEAPPRKRGQERLSLIKVRVHPVGMFGCPRKVSNFAQAA